MIRAATFLDSDMKQPGLDNRHRDENPPKTGQIQQKRGDTLNRSLDVAARNHRMSCSQTERILARIS